MNRLLHYTTAPLGEVRTVAQVPSRSEFDKPRGLWLSVEGDGDWREWCEANEFGDLGSQRCYEIVIAADANILRLSGSDLMHAFTAEYGTVRPYADSPYSILRDSVAIDWPRVVERYAGIIIAPYIWECRFGLTWYSGWDCASGCIWDASAIASVELVGANQRQPSGES